MKYVTSCEVCDQPLVECECLDGPTLPSDTPSDESHCPLCNSPMINEQLWEILNKDWPAIRIVKAARAFLSDYV